MIRSPVTSGPVLAHTPAMSRQIMFTELNRLGLQGRRNGVVLAIQKSVQRDCAGELDNLLITPVLLQTRHQFICDHVGL